MAKMFDRKLLYRMARDNVRPTYRKLRKMDRDDWLATIGLERRNVAVDVAGAIGFIVLGCAIGAGIGLLLAPKPGAELRNDLTRRVRESGEKLGIQHTTTSPTYAS